MLYSNARKIKVSGIIRVERTKQTLLYYCLVMMVVLQVFIVGGDYETEPDVFPSSVSMINNYLIRV